MRDEGRHRPILHGRVPGRGAWGGEGRAADTGTLDEKQYDAGGYRKGSEATVAMDAEEET